MRHLAPLFALAACTGGETRVDSDPPFLPTPVRTCEVAIREVAPSGARAGAVAGTFSNWEPRPMTEESPGVFSINLGELPPGTYPYKFVWDGVFEGDPPDFVPTAWDGGFENRALRVPDCRRPALEVLDVEINGDAGLFLIQAQAPPDAELDPSSVVVSVGGQELDNATLGEGGVIIARASGLRAGKHSIRASLSDTAGRTAELWLPVWVEADPFRYSDGVLYFTMVDRFRDGGESPVPPIAGAPAGTRYRGGDLVGLAAAIEAGELDDLGVRSLWISPVAQNPDAVYPGRSGSGAYTGYHGYWPSAPRAVEDHFGTADTPADAALRRVVQAAHDRQMRVILDVVLNHVHEDHPWVREHPDWITADVCVCGDPGCDWEEKARTCRFAPYLPDLEYRNPALVDAAVDEVWWWLSTFDLDGLRLDAAKHMDPVILRTLSLTLQERIDGQGGAHVLLLGETFAGVGEQDLIRSYVADYELDGQFDFPLMWRTRDVVRGTGDLRAWVAEAEAGDRAWGVHQGDMSPFFGNHDIPRLVTTLVGCPAGAGFGECPDPLASTEAGISPEQQDLIDRVTFAWALVVTQPGIPLLYQGDEVGQPGGEDPDNRPDMARGPYTEAQSALRGRIRDLARIRAASVPLRRGGRRALHVEAELAVIARGDAEDGTALVTLSRGATGTRTVTVPTELGLEGRTLVEATSGAKARVDGARVTLPVGRWSVGVWAPSD